jgi:hypothetical protein
MGFYGNITNVNRTQFSFDRIYSSRKSMDQNRTADGVYLGRYVLVEYDENGLDGMKRIWKIGNDYYFTKEADANTKLTVNNTSDNEVFYRAVNDTNPIVDANLTSEEDVRKARHIFYKRSNNKESFAINQIIDTNDQTQYTTNYHIDMAVYG